MFVMVPLAAAAVVVVARVSKCVSLIVSFR